jgi:hypothetical protein
MTTADLTEQLRAARPVAPGALHERVREIAAREAEPPARPRAHLPRLPRLRIALPAAAATALAAAAFLAVVRPEHQPHRETATQPPAATAASQVGRAAPARAKSAGDSARAQVHAAAAGAAAPSPTTGRAQDYQAQIGLEVENDDALSRATRQAMTITRSLGGYVVSAQYASGGAGTAALTLRVPTERVQEAIAQLTALGRITSQQVQIQDLQEQLDGLDRQIATLRQRIAHLTALLADPLLTPERKAELEARRAQLQDVLRTTRRERSGTAQQAALATIQLSLSTRARSATPPPTPRWRRSVDEAARILTWEGIAMLYALAVVAPFALLGGLAWLGSRARRRGSERRLLART